MPFLKIHWTTTTSRPFKASWRPSPTVAQVSCRVNIGFKPEVLVACLFLKNNFPFYFPTILQRRIWSPQSGCFFVLLRMLLRSVRSCTSHFLRYLPRLFKPSFVTSSSKAPHWSHLTRFWDLEYSNSETLLSAHGIGQVLFICHHQQHSILEGRSSRFMIGSSAPKKDYFGRHGKEMKQWNTHCSAVWWCPSSRPAEAFSWALHVLHQYDRDHCYRWPQGKGIYRRALNSSISLFTASFTFRNFSENGTKMSPSVFLNHRYEIQCPKFSSTMSRLLQYELVLPRNW